MATLFRVVDDAGAPILQRGLGATEKKVSAGWLFFQFAVAAMTLLLLVSALLFALLWGPAKIIGRMKSIPLQTVLFPLLATLSISVLFPLLATLSIVVSFVLPLALSTDLVEDLGSISGASLTIFIGSLVFVALTALSLHASFRSHTVQTGWLVRLHGRLVSVACTVALVYLWSNGLIGLRMWAY